MPCRNPDCERSKLSEGELIQATIETLRRIADGPFTHEVIACLDVDKPCVRCSCNQIANWFEDFRHIKTQVE